MLNPRHATGKPRSLEQPGDTASHFLAEHPVSAELAAALMRQYPANPFCTSSYAEALRAVGQQPWLFGTERGGQWVAACYGFSVSGRLNRALYVPSLPEIPYDDVFWNGLLRFCSRQRIAVLKLNSVGCSTARIPALPGEVDRHEQAVYVLDLGDRDWEEKVARKHWQNIRRAQRTGVTLSRSSDSSACREHLRCVAESMERRRKRRETIIPYVERNFSLLVLLLEKGAGELFQAVNSGEILSSAMILRSAQGAYYESSGTSSKGMECGASHFLIYSIARVLREESVRVFNLAEAEAPTSGLMQFKSRFGTKQGILEQADFYFGSSLRWRVTQAARFIRARVRG